MHVPSLLASLAFALALASPAVAEGRFFAPDQQSASGVIASDASGALHAAYSGYNGEARNFVTYRFCADACESAGNWQSASLPFTNPELIQIAVTPDGRPRLMIQSSTYVSGASTLFSYAECNDACTDAGNWTIAPVANMTEGIFGGIFQYRLNEHSFAVDAEGRPFFIYVDANYLAEPDHYGAFLTTCEAVCSDPENWTDTNLAVRIPENYVTESWDQVALAVTPDGRPRLLAKVWALKENGEKVEDDSALYYYECNEGCTERRNWSRSRILETGFGSYPNPGWDIEVLPDGRPRAVLFAGSEMKQPSLDNTLVYMWCDTQCGGGDANWFGHGVTAKGDGEAPDLALTADGHPRMAFLGGSGDLGYLSCDIDCETDHGKWSLVLQDSTDSAAADRPTALPYTCDAELWNGFVPRLAMSRDTPWFTYDLTVEARCLYKEFGQPEITYEFHELWRGARLSWGSGTLIPPPSGSAPTSRVRG